MFRLPNQSTSVSKDRYRKQIDNNDRDRGDANTIRAAATGAVAGALMWGKGAPMHRAAIGALAGGGSVVALRKLTEPTRDAFGERSRGARRAEALPALAGLGVAAVAARNRLRKFEAATASGIGVWKSRLTDLGVIATADLAASTIHDRLVRRRQLASLKKQERNAGEPIMSTGGTSFAVHPYRKNGQRPHQFRIA